MNVESSGPTMGMPVILLVEDNPDDVLLTRRAFRKAALDVSLSVANDGDEAIAWLDRFVRSEPHDHRLPSLVLLDLKLPKRSGLEILQWLREKPLFATVPVIVLTSSAEERDIREAYVKGANSYLMKPVMFNELVKMLIAIGGYWLQTNLTAAPSAPAK